MKRIRKRVFDLININNKDDIASRICNLVIVIAILINVAILIAETFEIPENVGNVLDIIEFVTLVIFIIEYALRIWTSVELYPGKGYGYSVSHFIFSFYGQVDLWSILPYILPLFIPTGLVALRALRVFRVLRLFRINTRYDAFNVVLDVIYEKRTQLLSSMVLIVTCMIASSLLMYSVEHPVQPDVFDNAFSGMWWSVSAMLTVGYGDVIPLTIVGRIIAIIMAFLGVGLVAIPTGIISAGFVEQYTKIKQKENDISNYVNFIQITMEKGHPWTGKMIKDLSFPPELLVVSIIRDDQIIMPRGDIVVEEEDVLVLSAIEFENNIGIDIRKVLVDKDSLWKDKKISEINFSENVVAVAIIRGTKTLIPRGNTVIRQKDIIILCEHLYSLLKSKLS